MSYSFNQLCNLAQEATQPLQSEEQKPTLSTNFPDFEQFGQQKESHTIATDNTTSPIDVTHSDKGAEEIEIILSKAPHYFYEDNPMKLYLKTNVVAAMTEYADLRAEKARAEAIQECINIFSSTSNRKHCLEELEKLKQQ